MKAHRWIALIGAMVACSQTPGPCDVLAAKLRLADSLSVQAGNSLVAAERARLDAVTAESRADSLMKIRTRLLADRRAELWSAFEARYPDGWMRTASQDEVDAYLSERRSVQRLDVPLPAADSLFERSNRLRDEADVLKAEALRASVLADKLSEPVDRLRLEAAEQDLLCRS
ncbi:hypothetical protein [Candidatus Palauibacter sp.]|uniref:hypothetical protein n=1 Tax=Candidatus Palauibacter sp. TaxID=3101350 RepID=UPI003B02E16C